MSKKELVSFCKPEETPAFGGPIHFKNPRYFYEHESIPAYATHFFAEDERVRKAYLKAGVVEYGKGQKQQEEKEEREVVISDEIDPAVELSHSEDAQIETFEASESEEGASEDGSPNIERMSWPELRAYAASLTDEPIKNKEVALRVIADNG